MTHRLVVFDVDGTLVDSQHHIHSAMAHAFEDAGLAPVPLAQVLGIVGLSLPQAVAELAPHACDDTQRRVVEGYKAAFLAKRVGDDAPLYPGALDCLHALAGRDDVVLAVATGKSRRGLDAMIETHGLGHMFISLQTADDHPSKPHPSMLLAALADSGLGADRAVMVGDTSFDMAMAGAAGMAAFGVAWGYHTAQDLHAAGAGLVAPDFAALTRAIEEWAA